MYPSIRNVLTYTPMRALLQFTLPSTSTVGALKQQLTDQLTLPSNKMRLMVTRLNQYLSKDDATLASFNCRDSEDMSLSVKTRGGKSKK